MQITSREEENANRFFRMEGWPLRRHSPFDDLQTMRKKNDDGEKK